MKITFLGTAGLVPGGMGLTVTGKRGQNCIMIDNDYLIETGDGALRNINAYGVDLNKIKKIMISHLHSDHSIGMVHVIFAMMNVRNRKEPLEIVGPPGVEKTIRGLMSLTELPSADDTKRGFDLIFRELGAAEKFDDVETVRGEHPSEAHAYKITRGGRSVFYNGESSFTKEVLDLARGVDFFICTVPVLKGHSFHIDPQMFGQAATDAGVKRAAAMHWPTQFEDNREALADMIRKHFDGEVMIPDDFTVVEV